MSLSTKELARIVEDEVKHFRYSTMEKLWHHVGSTIRGAFLDSIVVNVARLRDTTSAMTVQDLLTIRRDIERRLGEGIKRRNDTPLRFTVDE